jgi:hypothetical protein
MARAKAKVGRKKRQEEIRVLMDPKSQRKFEREAENHLIDLEERAAERYQWAKTLMDAQSEELQVAIRRLTVKMATLAGLPRFSYKGATINVDGGQERLNRLQYRNHLWIAMRLLVAAAEWGIRIGDFTAPKGECLRCGKKTR